jgi:hypothetical protein
MHGFINVTRLRKLWGVSQRQSVKLFEQLTPLAPSLFTFFLSVGVMEGTRLIFLDAFNRGHSLIKPFRNIRVSDR